MTDGIRPLKAKLLTSSLIVFAALSCATNIGLGNGILGYIKLVFLPLIALIILNRGFQSRSLSTISYLICVSILVTAQSFGTAVLSAGNLILCMTIFFGIRSKDYNELRNYLAIVYVTLVVVVVFTFFISTASYGVYFQRVSLIFDEPNHLAVYSACLYIAVHSTLKDKKPKWCWLVDFSPWILVAATQSISGFLIVLIFQMTLLYRINKNYLPLILFGISALIYLTFGDRLAAIYKTVLEFSNHNNEGSRILFFVPLKALWDLGRYGDLLLGLGAESYKQYLIESWWFLNGDDPYFKGEPANALTTLLLSYGLVIGLLIPILVTTEVLQNRNGRFVSLIYFVVTLLIFQANGYLSHPFLWTNLLFLKISK